MAVPQHWLLPMRQSRARPYPISIAHAPYPISSLALPSCLPREQQGSGHCGAWQRQWMERQWVVWVEQRPRATSQTALPRTGPRRTYHPVASALPASLAAVHTRRGASASSSSCPCVSWTVSHDWSRWERSRGQQADWHGASTLYCTRSCYIPACRASIRPLATTHCRTMMPATTSSLARARTHTHTHIHTHTHTHTSVW